MAIMYTELYLAHHGIKGQKWGVRRFQNEDGSLTAAGEKRYYTGSGNKTRIQRKIDKANAKENSFKTSDVFLARKALKKNKKYEGSRQNYNSAAKEYGKKLYTADIKDSNNGTTKNYNAMYFEAKKAVHKALLMDAGFSEKKAELGAEWMKKHNFDISFNEMFKVNDEERKHWDA